MIAKPGEQIYLRYKSPYRDTAIFPQAKIIDFDSGDVLATANLSANANISHLYEVAYTVPSDEGKYSIVITPYTDSGHTVVSEVEGDTIENLEVQTIAKSQPTTFGGNIITEDDIRMIADLVAKKLSKVIEVKMPELPAPQVVDTESIVQPILNAIASIPEPAPQAEVDFAPVVKAILGLEKLLKGQKIDLTPVLGKLGSLESAIKAINFAPLNQTIKDLQADLIKVAEGQTPDRTEEILNRIDSHMAGMDQMMNSMAFDMAKQKDLEAMKQWYPMVSELIAGVRDLILKGDELSQKRGENLAKFILQLFNSMNMVNTTMMANMTNSLQNQLKGSLIDEA